MGMKKFLDCLFGIIIVAVVIATFFLIYSTVVRHDSQPYTKVVVQVSEPVVFKDASGRDTILIEQSASTLDSLVCLFNAKSEEIDYKYELLLKARDNESFLLEILASIIALIMGVLSFLGFRSIKDIEESVKDKAEKIAKEKADESTTAILERMANSKVQEIAENYYNGNYKDALIAEIKSLVNREYIVSIEEKLSMIENSLTLRQEEIIEDLSEPNQACDIIVDPNLSEQDRQRMNQLTNQEKDESTHTANIP